MENYNRQCPYCGCHITVSDNNSEQHEFVLEQRDWNKQTKKVCIEHIVCPNTDCSMSIINIIMRYDVYSFPYSMYKHVNVDDLSCHFNGLL